MALLNVGNGFSHRGVAVFMNARVNYIYNKLRVISLKKSKYLSSTI